MLLLLFVVHNEQLHQADDTNRPRIARQLARFPYRAQE